ALGGNVGETVGGAGAAGSALVTLVDPTANRVDVNVDESDVAGIALGQTARISFDALSGKQLGGKVLGLSPSATLSQGGATYTATVSIEDADASVQPGMTANVEIVVAEKADALVVPSRALRPGPKGASLVELPSADGGRELKLVKTGIVGEQLTEVVDGLAE